VKNVLQYFWIMLQDLDIVVFTKLFCNRICFILAQENLFLNQLLTTDHDKTITIDFPFCDNSLYELSKKD